MFACAATIGSSITFLCGATGNPMPEFGYDFSGVGDPHVKGGNIDIESVMETSAGNYTCNATSLDRFPLEIAKRIFQLYVGGKSIPLDPLKYIIMCKSKVIYLYFSLG